MCCCGSPMLPRRWWRISGKNPRAHDGGGIRRQLCRLPPPFERLHYACACDESLTAAWVQRLPLRTPKSPLPHAFPKLTPHVFRSASYLVQMPPPCTRLRLLRHIGLAAGVAGVAGMALQLNCRCEPADNSKSVALAQLHIRAATCRLLIEARALVLMANDE